MSIKEYENAVKDCFQGSVQSIWYGESLGKIGNDPNCMYVAIVEDENWWKNRCILRDWYFNYDALEILPLEMDCEEYGVYSFRVRNNINI